MTGGADVKLGLVPVVCLVADPELDGLGAGKGLVAFGAAATAGPRHATWAAAVRVRVSHGVKRTGEMER